MEFTHSQSFETFVRCHLHAFQFLGGVARELWYDNLATDVAEHDGNLVRFHPQPSGLRSRIQFPAKGLPGAGGLGKSAERFEKELLAQLTAAQRSAEQQRLVSLLGPP